MKADPIREENTKFVVARLKLAQALLEESDALPRRGGYDFSSNDEWWRHSRHEREALVNYLLLTCFDRLGQERGYTTFQDWLKSKRPQHASEREQVLNTFVSTTPTLECASALADHYQLLYGVRNSFYRGIESLPDNLRKDLLESVSVRFDPIYGTLGPNTSTPSYPLESTVVERRMKMKYLYDKRNRFTHRLEQYFAGSSPLASRSENGPSWFAMIKDSHLHYGYGNQEIERLPAGGARVYQTRWPFVLFETLHAAVGSAFHRTDIKLRFSVDLHSSEVPDSIITIEVNHEQLKAVQALESHIWKLHAIGSIPARRLIHL